MKKVTTNYENKTVSSPEGTITFSELFGIADEISKSSRHACSLQNLKERTGICEAELSRIFKTRLSPDEIARIMLSQPLSTSVWGRCKPVRNLTLRQVSSGECYRALFETLEKMKISLPKH